MAQVSIGSDVWREAIASLLAHRLRAILSAIGIVTGVATIVAALAIAAGAREQAIAEVAHLGVDNIIVRATSDSNAPGHRAPVLSLTDAEAIARGLPTTTVATLRANPSTVRFGDRSSDATVAGVNPEWRTTAGLSIDRGRWLTAGDKGTRPTVIGGSIADVLFRGADPIGQRIEAAGEWRTVVGVLPSVSVSQRPPSMAVHGFDSSHTVFVPLESLDLSLGLGDEGSSVNEIVVRVPAGGDVTRGAAAIRHLLAERHEADAASFEVIVPRELLAARLRAQRSFHILLLSIGALALVVSGVGIMNIMVASVTERAVEIGIRRAFGARRSTILAQFATEAGLLSAVAGVIGIPLGLFGAFITAWMAGWPVAVTFVSVFIAFGLAIGVGLAAAIYPAHLATTLSPTEALRT